MSQDQFLNVIDRDEAERRFRAAITLRPLGTDLVPLDVALGRVLAEDVVSPVDVPSFDRSNYDGYALRAADSYGAREGKPRRLALLAEVLAIGVAPTCEIRPGTAVTIATGGMLPRGADAVTMVEHTEVGGASERAESAPCGEYAVHSTQYSVSNLSPAPDSSPPSPLAPLSSPFSPHPSPFSPHPSPLAPLASLLVTKAVTPGFGISFAGTDIAAGETVLRRGEVLGSRETGVLAAIGAAQVTVWRRPKVAVISTGDEIIAPGQRMRPGLVYDSNARILADAVRELGGEPVAFGILPDDAEQLRARLHEALQSCDVVLLSGGTSKGEGDLSYRVVSELSEPGIVAHGVALKPGKPICLAAHRGKPVVILPGFPTSAIFTFHEFVAPVLRALGGRYESRRPSCVEARMAVKINSEIGRTEYLLVGLVEGPGGLTAYPMGKGSGSVTTFSRADGFVTIGRHEEIVAAGATVAVQLLGGELRLADLVVIGSQCVGLDFLLGKLQDMGFHTKFMAVGSTAGLQAAQRGECDLAGCHLLDPATGIYNVPLLTPELELIPGYGRLQGVVFRQGDPRFAGGSAVETTEAIEAIARVKVDPACVMVNRNQGSGTRILIDRLLEGAQPAGYAVQVRSHNAVAAAVAQGRADWGVAIERVARDAGFGFLPLEEERYDFIVPKARRDRPAVAAFRVLLGEPAIREELARMGFGKQAP